MPLRDFASNVDVASLRGGLEDVLSLAPWVSRQTPGRWKLVVLDAFYRFMPADSDENDNGTMARVYNRLDAYARHLGCSFVLVHHATKGSQAGKAVTDVGAGAGAQSRATDTHLVLRPHEEDGCVVLDAAVRSWPPVEPRCLRWTFPVWNPDDSLDPEALRVEGRRRKKEETPAEEPWTVDRFARSFVGERSTSRADILVKATQAGLSERKALTLLKGAESVGAAFRLPRGPRDPAVYSRVPQGDIQ